MRQFAPWPLWTVACALLAAPCSEALSTPSQRGGDRRPEGALIQTWRAHLDSDEGTRASESPVTKVVNLLKEMSATLQQEMDEDAAMFKQLGCWCTSNLEGKREAVAAAQAALNTLNATIESLTSKESELQQTISQLEDEMATSKKALAEATALREKEAAQFHAMETDAIANIEALKAAIVVLGNHHGEGPAALPSLLSVKRSSADRSWSLSLEEGWDSDETAVLQRAMKAAASFAQAKHSEESYLDYAPRSGEILGILKQLKDEMSAGLNESQTEEMARKDSYEELRSSKQAEITALEQQAEQHEDRLATTTNDLAEAKEDYHQTEEALGEDIKFLLSVEQTCKDGDKAFEERKVARTEEMKAVADTIAILASDEATEAAAGTFGAAASFLQLSKGGRSRAQAAELLRRAAAKAKNPEMSILATSVELDSFTRVKKAIDDMIEMLKVQQADEVKKNDWCNGQIQENEMETSRTDNLKTDLSSKVDDLTSQLSTLEDEVAAAKKQIEQLHVEMQRASENRKEENLDFQHTIADQRAVQAVLQEALTRLRKFYDKAFLQTKGKSVDKHAANGKAQSGLGAALLKALGTRQEPPPAPVQAEYKPHGGSGGVMEMIGKCIQDARALEDEAVAGEQKAQDQYEAVVADTTASVAALQKEVVSKTQMKAQATKDKAETEANLMDTVKDLEELQKININLHSECEIGRAHV